MNNVTLETTISKVIIPWMGYLEYDENYDAPIEVRISTTTL